MAKVLIVDDEVDLTDSYSTVLKGEGHDVIALNTMSGAIEKIKAESPDVMVLDVMFPEDPSAGMKLAMEIRKHDEIKDIPIIMLTGVNEHFPLNFTEKDIDDTWMPVQRFIEKPVDLKKLSALVKESIAG